MPDLRHEGPAGLMNSCSDFAPAGECLLAVKVRVHYIGGSHRMLDRAGLSDTQRNTARSAAAEVIPIRRAYNSAPSEITPHGRHHDPVGQVQSLQAEGREQRGQIAT